MSTRLSKKAELSAMYGGADLMAIRMKEKLKRKARQGLSGGLDQENAWRVAQLLRVHVDRLTGHGGVSEPHQAIDVCNLAMMLWVQAGSPIKATHV